MTDVNDAQPRKPRIALMGEFSAGKSTLSNLLLGSRPLPERVTATRLSPVWISKGESAAYREHLDGRRDDVNVDEIGSVPIEDTRVIRLFMESDMLDNCDLIDCPGISDPNMPSEVWERLIPEIDAVLWCTHATQAWRQSEAAVWETIPEEVRTKSVLLITRFDKLTTEKDRHRVLARVSKATRDHFAALFPISLTNAIAAGDDPEKWAASGAHHFAEYLMLLIDRLQNPDDNTAMPKAPEIDMGMAKTEKAEPAKPQRPAAKKPEPEQADTTVTPIKPRRVVSGGAVRPQRPRPSRPIVPSSGETSELRAFLNDE